MYLVPSTGRSPAQRVALRIAYGKVDPPPMVSDPQVRKRLELTEELNSKASRTGGEDEDKDKGVASETEQFDLVGALASDGGCRWRPEDGSPFQEDGSRTRWAQDPQSSRADERRSPI